jgi:membrane protease YdiL (CAAX protease family)
MRELARFFAYTLPALGLLWYLIPERDVFSPLASPKRPGIQDFYTFGIGFAGLVAIGSLISFLMMHTFPFPSPPARVEAPGNAFGWIVMLLSCMGTGYLEESFFRYYLIQKFEELCHLKTVSVLFSTALFAMCHVYEGVWGVANAALAALLLSFLFEKWRVIHGIAWAHGAYNVFVYTMGIFGA